MELDELKVMLKSAAEKPQQKTAGEIAAMLGGKTRSVANKIKRSLILEIIFCIVFMILFCWYGIAGDYWPLRIYLSVFAGMSFLFLFVLFFLWKKTKIITGSVHPVKKTLEHTVAILKEYVKRYMQITMLLIPVCMIFSLVLVKIDAQKSTGGEELHFFHSAWKEYTFIGLYYLAFAAGMYFFAKWYLKKFYGNHIAELEHLIKELDDE